MGVHQGEEFAAAGKEEPDQLRRSHEGGIRQGRGTHARDHEGHSAPHIQDPQGRFLRKHPESCTEVVAVIVWRPNPIDDCCRRRQAARVGWIIIEIYSGEKI